MAENELDCLMGYVLQNFGEKFRSSSGRRLLPRLGPSRAVRGRIRQLFSAPLRLDPCGDGFSSHFSGNNCLCLDSRCPPLAFDGSGWPSGFGGNGFSVLPEAERSCLLPVWTSSRLRWVSLSLDDALGSNRRPDLPHSPASSSCESWTLTSGLRC